MPRNPDFSVVHFTDSDDYRVLEEISQEFVCRAANLHWAETIAHALTVYTHLKEAATNHIASNFTPEQEN